MTTESASACVIGYFARPAAAWVWPGFLAACWAARKPGRCAGSELSAWARHRGQLYHLCTLLGEVCIRACIITDPQRLQSTAFPPSFMSVEKCIGTFMPTGIPGPGAF